MQPSWLPEPERGTAVCLGFDGSDVSDWTAIRGETMDDGYAFTPRFAHGPTIWNPAEQPDHRISRMVVSEAVEELFERFDVVRFYCDPPGWQSEIEAWSRAYPDRALFWETYRPNQMAAALERFVTDLSTGALTHDGCPLTTAHVGNAVKAGRKNDTYVLAKASKTQKIDAAMAAVLAHEARADALAAGWVAHAGPSYFRLPR